MAESPRVFTYEQALDTFPAVRDVTAHAVHQVQALYGYEDGFQGRVPIA